MERSSIENYDGYLQMKSDLNEQKSKCTQQLLEVDKELQELRAQKAISASKLAKAKSDYEALLKKQSINDISARALLAFDELQKTLYDKSIRLVETGFSQFFASLINKSDLIDGIHIDDSLNVLPYKNKHFKADEIHKIIGKNGVEYLIAQIGLYAYEVLQQKLIVDEAEFELPVEVKQQLSAGEKQIFIMKDFVMHPDDSILILSRDARNLSKLLDLFDRLPGDYRNDTLFVFDEVHGAGSNTFVENLSGRLSPYRYRLGLSATPEREYDEAGNDFLLNEIGEVIFEFTLQDAIQKGILCEFNYIPLPYVLSDEEKLKKRKIIAAFNAKKESGEPVDEKDMFTQLALVNKTAVNKLEEFESLISQRPELLQKCIIFVQTMEYGAKLQEILVRYSDKYHTYYADDEKINLENFAAGKIDCLLTCKKVSEGIDISSVTNIILFSSDRSRLVTTQRIGRALRLDKNNPEKKATVVDFVIEDSEENDNNADADRAEWLTDLSQTRRCEHEK